MATAGIYDPSKLNYPTMGAPQVPTMNLQSGSAAPPGLPMLGTARGAGPLNMGSLLGMGRNVAPPGQLPGMPPFAGGPGSVSPAPPGMGGGGTGAPGMLPQPLLDQTATNLGGALRGELPPDVINMLQTQAAERGVGGGVGGSQFAEYGGLRTLGLTSLDRMKHAEDLLAGQFANPRDQMNFEQSRLDRESLDRRSRAELEARTKHDADVLVLQRQQEAARAAEQANQLAQRKLEFDLQALGGKYGGVGGAGGFGQLPTRTNFYGGEDGPGPLNRLF